MMKTINRKRLTLAILIGLCIVAMAVHAVYVSCPHVWFTATFPAGEELEIIWKPSPEVPERFCGRGQLFCMVTGAEPIELVYGQFNVYQATKFVRQDAIAWDENDENTIPAYTITEIVQGVQWGIDHKGGFLGSN